MPKPAYTIQDQIALLKSRGMSFRDKHSAPHFLQNISYYRLKGYWWDLQADRTDHVFQPDTYFEDIVDRYNFDRHLRLILFDAVERIEIALRTQLIYQLSLAYGPCWYQDFNLFTDPVWLAKHLATLMTEFERSQEIFVVDHKRRFPDTYPESWKIMEVASMGTLSKYYKNLKHNLPEKAAIAKGMGLNLHKELSSWLEAIVYVRNILAHHSRLWSRDMVKRPILALRNPSGSWLNLPLDEVQQKKPFLIISCMLFLSNKVTPNHQIKAKILDLFSQNPEMPIYKLGFFNNWEKQDLWR
ncbi:Abi family protein [Algoriphagus sp. H41]|uniref:Abi family protein n=1 Tax=Algoriphagus oliviformis TaxID=2811231 RepID=A0ABS3BZA3_9BACT|nr:Abi family protein [Algoriphagus oliviformis]MBN7810184.1 Abi family protein [Algoriphagus oliviformis]